jgi:hypothetical protein
MMSTMRILMILVPSDDSLRTEPALRLDRVVEPYYLFQDSGVEVVLASPAGGSAWTRRKDQERALPTALAQRFRADLNAHDAFADTLSLEQVFADDFQAAFCVGEITYIWRSKGNDRAASLVAKMLATGKPVAIIPDTVDYAPAGAGEGLLILARARNSPLLAARALLRVMNPHWFSTTGAAPPATETCSSTGDPKAAANRSIT